jgi:hypothetical protein
MSFRETLEPYHNALARIIQTTLDHHGNLTYPWGTSPDTDWPLCEYSAGCAIGPSLRPETARMADEARFGSIFALLDSGSTEAEGVLQDLFDTKRVPVSVVVILIILLHRYQDTLTLNTDAP